MAMGSAQVRLEAGISTATRASHAAKIAVRHSALVRLTHWITTLAFFALLVTGVEILISHPRFYWGETGNVNVKPLFSIPIPSSRRTVPTGYNYVMPDQNGWSRALHFQAAWLLLFTGLLYGVYGFFSGHFRKDLLPGKPHLSWHGISSDIANHLRFKPPTDAEVWSYNLLQRFTYLFVIFVLFPLVIWSGLAMSPAFTAAFPSSVILLGGRQSARTIHFFVTLALVLFLLVHVVMIAVSGFGRRMRAMISGRVGTRKESL